MGQIQDDRYLFKAKSLIYIIFDRIEAIRDFDVHLRVFVRPTPDIVVRPEGIDHRLWSVVKILQAAIIPRSNKHYYHFRQN